MTSDRDQTPDDVFATELADLLDRRAAQVEVHPGLDGLLDRAGAGDVDHRIQVGWPDRWRSVTAGPMRTALAAAAVIVVGLIGVLAVSALGGNEQEFAIQDAVSEALTSDRGSEDPTEAASTAIIWLDVGASDANVIEIANWLDRNTAVDEHRYVDQAATYAEFREYFKDEPEILELVHPGQLPTSFVVTTTDPIALAVTAGHLAGVEEVEIGD